MKRLISTLKDLFEFAREGVYYDAYMDGRDGDPISKARMIFETWIFFFALAAKHIGGGAVCKVAGHHVAVHAEEFAAGSPPGDDGGGVDWECRCCGQGGRGWW